jgi:hypothetical protein
MLDMELLYHYTLYTCFTLSHEPIRQHIRQHYMVELALKHDFILHSILCLSALHLAFKDPTRKEHLTHVASELTDKALVSFRKSMQAVSRENADALFAFSSNIVLCAWANDLTPGHLFFTNTIERPGERPELQWIGLLRSIRSILKETWIWVESGPLKPLLRLKPENDPPPLTPEVEQKFSDLKSVWEPNNDRYSAQEILALDQAFEALKDAYILIIIDRDVCKVAVTYFWPVTVSEYFTTMINQQKPASLVVLAYYCIILHEVRSFWWIQNMGTELFQNIEKILGEQWSTVLEWPREMLKKRTILSHIWS